MSAPGVARWIAAQYSDFVDDLPCWLALAQAGPGPFSSWAAATDASPEPWPLPATVGLTIVACHTFGLQSHGKARRALASVRRATCGGGRLAVDLPSPIARGPDRALPAAPVSIFVEPQTGHPVHVSAHTRRRPVFLVASEKDNYSADTTLEHEALGQAELHVPAGGAHGTQIFFTQSELLGELVHFLEVNLAPRG
jgi:hypothetical protein